MTSSQRRRSTVLLGIGLWLAWAVPGLGQESGKKPEGTGKQQQDGIRWFSGPEPFAPLIADPLETQIRGSIVSARLDLTGLEGADSSTVDLLEQRSAQAEVVIGYRQNVVQFQEETTSRPALAIAFEVGVFSRFLLETSQRDLISADFRVGLPFEIAWSGWEGRFEILHMSSHFGDDLFDRLGIANAQVTFDGFQLLAARRLIPQVRLYVGGNLNFHSNPGVEDLALQWGVEWDRSEVEPKGHVFPLVAADFRITDESERVAGTALAGATFRISDVRLQLALRGHFGPSAIGKFRNFDESFLGLGLRIIP